MSTAANVISNVFVPQSFHQVRSKENLVMATWGRILAQIYARPFPEAVLINLFVGFP